MSRGGVAWRPEWSSALVEALDAGVLVVSPEGAVVLANAHAAQILGQPREALVGQGIDAVLGPMERLRRGGTDAERVVVEVRVPGRGESLPVGVSVSPFSVAPVAGTRGGRGIYEACLFRDLSRLIAVQRERDRLLQLATVGDMLPSLLHELRNPLAAICASVEVLIEEESAAPVRAEMHAILTEVRRAILGMQGIGAVGKDLKSDRYHAADAALVDVTRILDATASRAGVRVRCEVPFLPVVPLEPSVLRALAFNLVGNAIAASSPGQEVVLSAGVEAGDWFTLTVSDEGTGMTPEVLARATELFFTTKRHGSGIGLALCRRAVECADGTLAIDSQPGLGTRVSLRVPLSRVSHRG